MKSAMAAFCVGQAAVAMTASVAAYMPTQMWTNVKRVQILCNVAGGPGIDHVAMTAQLCREVKRLASKGAPLPVATIAIGDPAVLASDAVTLLVHASVTDQPNGRLMAFSLRPYRSSDPAGLLFGAVPRVAPMSAAGAAGPALDAALAAALSETLPWLARPRSPQALTVSH
jgi:hypothetical protein